MGLFTKQKPEKIKKEKPQKPANPYVRELSEDEVRAGEHRTFVGGKWDEFGKAQFDFLVSRGLRPEHRFLDVGCGALRGGIHFIRHLEQGRYHGIDMNASLLGAGKEVELVEAGLVGKAPKLLLNSKFEFAQFETTFHFALALSVFTHVPVNSIERCLVNVASVLEPGGKFFVTFFEAPTPHHLQPIPRSNGGSTQIDEDPYHYHFSLFPFLIQGLPLTVTNLGAWESRKLQHMLEFTKI